MLRFFRHADGAFGHFNGMGSTPADQLATVLAYDDARGRPVQNASWSGYQRLEAAGTVVLADTGTLPPLALSGNAHAGFLSFELSSGINRFVVNCGATEDDRFRLAARSTPAHSTVTVEDSSSARFFGGPAMRRRFGALVGGGPRAVPVIREDVGDGIHVTARHDGYAAAFGIVHERSLWLAADGDRLAGVDRLIAGRRRDGRDRFAVRFHLHPAIRATRTGGGDVLLVAPDGEAWTFSSPLIEPDLAESVYLSEVHGRRRAVQIVLAGRVRATPEVPWSLTRTSAGVRGRPVRLRNDGGHGDLFG